MSAFVSRFGMMAQKVGMSRIFLEKKAVAITLLKLPENHVLEKKQCDGYSVLKIGVTDYKGKVKQPQAKHFERQNLPQCTLMKEFRVTDAEATAAAEKIDANWINVGCLIDIQSKSIGKGFAGVMKKWHFRGGSASHGTSLFHRGVGSTGTRDKIFKNRKMPGRMGQDTITIQGQKVVFKDDELGVIGLLGSVPGKKGTWVRVTKAMKGSGVEYGN